MTSTAFRDELRALGTEINPQMIGGTIALYTRNLPEPLPVARHVSRNIAYGPDFRHQLDIFTNDEGTEKPVLVYVHGGGFVAGDKVLPGTPFYDNIGVWAAQQGFVGVTMTYRLAPDHGWPAGAQDVAAAVAWLRQNVAAHGGSPRRIFVMGQSAGAAHVASYLAMPQLHDSSPPIAGAFLFSGIYDVRTLNMGPMDVQYFGQDSSRAMQQSSLSGLVASDVPMLFTVAEHDPFKFQQQAAVLTEAWFAAKQQFPRMIHMQDTNHLSAALAIGGNDDRLEPEITAFIARFSPHP